MLAIKEKEVSVSHHDENWLLQIESQWQLYSGKNDKFVTENTARQAFFNLAQQQLQLENHLSTARCLLVLETDQRDDWRVWQLKKAQLSLFDLLIAAIKPNNEAKIAALLLVAGEKLLLAQTLFNALSFYPSLTLETLSLMDNKLRFIDFIPTQALAENKQLSVTDLLQQGFQTTIEKIAADNYIERGKILASLKHYAHGHRDHGIILDNLQHLFNDTASQSF